MTTTQNVRDTLSGIIFDALWDIEERPVADLGGPQITALTKEIVDALMDKGMLGFRDKYGRIIPAVIPGIANTFMLPVPDNWNEEATRIRQGDSA